MADEVPGMAPSALSVPSRKVTKYIGRLCCDKATWAVFHGKVVTTCIDHGSMYDFEPLEDVGGTRTG